jgi:hypothetical protein
MKKGTLFSIVLLLSLGLAACGSSGPASNQGSGTPRTLPLSSKLLIGTLRLEKTPDAVDAPQAAALLPLWQLFKSINASSTVAPQETDAVVQQIQAAMTPSQIKAIEAMNLSGRDIFTTMQQMGLAPQEDGTPFTRPAGGFGNGGSGPRFGDGGPNGGPGGGQVFVNPGGGQGLSPQQIATAQARRSQGGFANRVPAVLLDALIKLLESRVTPISTVTPRPAASATEGVIGTVAPALIAPTATPTP